MCDLMYMYLYICMCDLRYVACYMFQDFNFGHNCRQVEEHVL